MIDLSERISRDTGGRYEIAGPVWRGEVDDLSLSGWDGRSMLAVATERHAPAINRDRVRLSPARAIEQAKASYARTKAALPPRQCRCGCGLFQPRRRDQVFKSYLCHKRQWMRDHKGKVA